MALYESVFIARQDVSATQVDTLADNFEKIISDNGGSIERREYWGLRTLAYRIKKNRKGHYVMFNMEAPSDAVQEMERNMRLNEDILRYMTIRLDEMRDEASPIMQGKGDRDRDRADRGPRRDGRDNRDRDRDPAPKASETENEQALADAKSDGDSTESKETVSADENKETEE